MALKNLIERQTVTIDDHKRGCREIKDWDNLANDIHIHKETNYKIEGVVQKVTIKIPINSDKKIKIESVKKDLKEIPNKLKKEIQQAFEDKETRDSFIKDVVNHIKNFETNLEDEKRVQQVLSNISKHFDLKWTEEKIATYTNNVLTRYIQKYVDSDGNRYTITVDKTKIKIRGNNKRLKRKH